MRVDHGSEEGVFVLLPVQVDGRPGPEDAQGLLVTHHQAVPGPLHLLLRVPVSLLGLPESEVLAQLALPTPPVLSQVHGLHLLDQFLDWRLLPASLFLKVGTAVEASACEDAFPQLDLD